MGDGRVDVSMIFAGVSLLISALAVPLALGRIGPNAFYGVRLQATLADRRVWFEVNRIIGRELVCVGVLLAGILVRALAVTTRSEMSQVDDSDGSAEGGS
jgi:uncharacterized membrane protein